MGDSFDSAPPASFRQLHVNAFDSRLRKIVSFRVCAQLKARIDADSDTDADL